MKEEINENLNKCLECIKKPCRDGCPLNNDTTGFIKLMKEKKYKEAYELLCDTTVLSSICGRICPHSKQCEGSCIGKYKNNVVEIGQLEAYIGDLAIENNWKIPMFTNVKNGKKVAIIGGGPAGITCSAFLVRNGFDVTIYEKHSSLGGIIEHGIPEFRLQRNTIDNTINKILDLGIKVKYNIELGKDFNLKDIEDKYDFIFLSFGKNISSKMGIDGEDKKEVLGGNELLEYKNYPNFKDKNVAVIGGGNVAIDTSRTIKNLGAKNVTVIYRRSREEMPAEVKELQYAENEGIKFLFQTNILKIFGKNKVEKIECIKTELIEREGETRKYPINIKGSNFNMDIDYVVMAVGSNIDQKLVNSLGLELTERGQIKINENYQTSNSKIYAGGDLTNSRGTVAWAARIGRNVADIICKQIK